MSDSICILSNKISIVTTDDILKIINDSITNKIKLSICYLNVHICLEAEKNIDLKNSLNSFDIIQPDGIGIFLAAKVLYGNSIKPERQTGTDLYFELFKKYSSSKFFLLGGAKDYSNKIRNFLDNSKLTIEQEESIKDDSVVISEINCSKSDILLVGLGTPYQEMWVNKYKEKIDIPVIICVGSGLDFLSGERKRAPEIIRKFGMEWIFRITQEPKRLLIRYIKEIPIFIIRIIKQKLQREKR